jgi:hypothetical protein
MTSEKRQFVASGSLWDSFSGSGRGKMPSRQAVPFQDHVRADLDGAE